MVVLEDSVVSLPLTVVSVEVSVDEVVDDPGGGGVVSSVQLVIERATSKDAATEKRRMTQGIGMRAARTSRRGHESAKNLTADCLAGR